jgi:beta-lactamase superfamily II metal-dependent hydrolase
MPSLTVLDVGHGNCAVVEDEGIVVIVDAPRRGGLLRFLDERKIRTIAALFLSHADADHIDGAVPLLVDDRYTPEHVYLNPDPIRKTAVWDDLKEALRIARQQSRSILHTTLNSTDPGTVTLRSVTLEVVSPSPEMALSGPGSRLAGHRLTANTNSAVLLLSIAGERRALLAADIDDVGLDLLAAEGRDLTAPVLVFPHHGGLPGQGDPAAFAAKLCALVAPKQVIFSMGRGAYDNPRPEVIEAVRHAAASAHLACTQLSRRCQAHPHTGRQMCAGTITIDLDTGSWQNPVLGAHRGFVDTLASPMCRRVTLG